MKLDPNVIDGTLMCLPPCSFRPALNKVQRIARDERCSNTVLSAIIGNDPGMALLVLSRANFAHDRDEGFLGISSSINRLGLGGTAALLDEIAVIPEHLVRPLGPSWASASAAVTMSRLLLDHVNAALFPSPHDRDLVAACAVLFDIGSTIAIRGFGEQCTQAATRLAAGEDNFPLLLKEELGMGPGQLAQRYITHWGLPDTIGQALAQQYQPIPEDGEPFPLACLMHVVRSMVWACGYPSGINPFVPDINQQALATLGMRGNDLMPIVNEFFEEMRHLEFFEVASAAAKKARRKSNL